MSFFNQITNFKNLQLVVFAFLLQSSLLLSVLPVGSSNNITNSTNNTVPTGRPSILRGRERPFSLFPPEAYGPYYGFVFDTETASKRQIPSSAQGSCKKGTSYRITSPQDLQNYSTELQCIFSSALTPSKVPEGPYVGKALIILNSRRFLINPLVNYAWRGNFVFKTECHGSQNSTDYIGFHNVLGRAVVPYIAKVESLKVNLAPGEYEDGRGSVIQDFTQDFSKVCPDYAKFVERNKSSLPTSIKTLANVYPFTQALDPFRLVGRQKDGGAIYLGKTYLKDYYRRDNQAVTIAFWYAVGYDPEVNPEFQAGQELPAVEEGYTYTFPGVADIILRYLPVDNFISRPFSTLLKFNQGVYKTGRASFLNFREFLRNVGSMRLNSLRLKAYFDSSRSEKT